MESLKEFLDNEYKKRNIKRVGKCNLCGKCCDGGLKVYETWYSNGGNTVRIKRVENEPCSLYDPVKKRCKEYNTRTGWCTLFPYLPENLFEGCGYKFIEGD